MSLIRQIVALIAGVVLLALLGAVSLNVLAARQTLQSQLRLKNADNATSLALALSQHKGDGVAIQLLVAAQFDTGHYRFIRLEGIDGQTIFERVSQRAPVDAPAWFVGLLPLDSAAGLARVSDGWREIGTLSVQSHTAYAHDALWSGAVGAAGWLTVVGLLACAVAAVVVRALRRPLDATVEQADALQEGRFVSVAEPKAPELRTLVRAMNAMVQRLRSVFEAQAKQVEGLRDQAERDSMTGLANRRHFMARLDALLTGERGSSTGGLLLVRVQDLDAFNRRVGRVQADRVLHAVAQSLGKQEVEVAGSFSGRLNGSDFALYWPGPRSTEQAGSGLASSLQSELPSIAKGASVCIGSTDLEGLSDLGSALAAVDDALAQAETLGAFGWSHRDTAALNTTLRREDEWRERIERALAEGGAELVEFPVVDAAGGLMHLECPLRLRFDSNGAPVAAAQWLAHAARSGLTPQLDLRAVQLALAAIDSDGRSRGVHVGLDSLTSVGFIGALRHSLEARSRLCPLLLLELPERAWVEHAQLLRDAVSQWSATGAVVGLEHAGGASAHLGRLYDLGLEFVKVDRRHLDGVAGSDDVRHFAASMVALFHSMRIKVIAEGVRSQEDLAALWQLGFDGATGPAVRL